jgi:hypothetical protein
MSYFSLKTRRHRSGRAIRPQPANLEAALGQFCLDRGRSPRDSGTRRPPPLTSNRTLSGLEVLGYATIPRSFAFSRNFDIP